MGAEWFKNAVIYQILIDRFAGHTRPKEWNQPVFIGGNLRGIIDKIDYIQSLGVNTLWISPFYQTDAYHGYHITDFMKIDSRFGTLEDLLELTDKVHRRRMRIIADFVPNHCSRNHPFFKEAQSDPDSPYRQWFYFRQWPEKYLTFLSIHELPKLNLEHPEARDHIIDAAKYWLSMGLDGFRLDHCVGPTHDFWKIFYREVKAAFPDCVLIGEAWLKGISFRELRTIHVHNKFLTWTRGQAPEELFKAYIGELDGVLDFRFQEIMRDFARGKINQTTAAHKCRRHLKKYPPGFYLVTFLDNHDMDRFLFECGQDQERLKTAAEIQFSLNQPAIIYYGTEAGMTQEKSHWDCPSHGDLQARQPMEWNQPDMELLIFYKRLISRGL